MFRPLFCFLLLRSACGVRVSEQQIGQLLQEDSLEVLCKQRGASAERCCPIPDPITKDFPNQQLKFHVVKIKDWEKKGVNADSWRWTIQSGAHQYKLLLHAHYFRGEDVVYSFGTGFMQRRYTNISSKVSAAFKNYEDLIGCDTWPPELQPISVWGGHVKAAIIGMTVNDIPYTLDHTMTNLKDVDVRIVLKYQNYRKAVQDFEAAWEADHVYREAVERGEFDPVTKTFTDKTERSREIKKLKAQKLVQHSEKVEAAKQKNSTEGESTTPL